MANTKLTNKTNAAQQCCSATPAPESNNCNQQQHSFSNSVQKSKHSENNRYLSSALKHYVWHRDKGQCSNCGSQRNLNYDHIKPLALGGESKAENLRLLCFQCNQREAIKVFGVEHIEKKKSKEKEKTS